MRKIIIFLLMFLICMTSCVLATSSNDDDSYKTLKAEVIEAGEVYKEETEYSSFEFQDVKVHIKDQGYNTTKDIKYSISYYTDMVATTPPLEVGDKVYVYTVFEDGKMIDAQIAYRNNSGYMLLIIVMYATAMIVVGGFKGFKALISLTITIFSVFFIILPQMLAGVNPLFITILTSIGIICVTIFITEGINKKAISAILGTISGILIASGFAVIFGNIMALSGVTEEARMLIGSIDGNKFDFRGILFAGMVIGALGECMDVSVSIASALNELKKENPNITSKRLMRAGMNIGGDVMGTMSNTLILAYMGESIILIMVFMSTNLKFYEIINQEMMVEEILRAIAGSFALVITIPVTALITSLMICKKDGGRE